MRLLPCDPELRRRATAPGTSLGAAADGLARELSPWLEQPLPVSATKARLTRIGGRCPQHGVLLDFDPQAPDDHRCPVCLAVFTGAEHHQWWVMGAHLFTAERVVHAAALYLLRGDTAHRDLARRTLAALALQYERWPNRDNVLGPSRPFFSTYLESIWLLNICHALALLEQAGDFHASEAVRDRILLPSSALIDAFHEQRSNRQVWNEVAVLSAWTLLGQHDRVHGRLDAPGSLQTLLRDGLLPDGTWYEGENYHQFAHRGLWYGMQLLDALGRPVEGELRSRFHEGFSAPFSALLPDETLPSRRDSPYAVSVRQWRWAEWCELGYAFAPDRRLAATLARIYDGSPRAGETGRAHSTADAERNRLPVALSRADVGWRALLMAQALPVPTAEWSPGSVVQPRQGVAVLRRERGRVYIALEGGDEGGGHGHPDRLALTVQRDAQRVLDDPGTGSYVERTLHWYRSTLAHHAPLVNGASQSRGPTTLTAFEDRGGAGWVQKVAAEIAPGVSCTRTLVVCDGYLVDVLDWKAAGPVVVTLPVGADVRTNIGDWQAATRPGAGALEDGFDFLQAVEEALAPPDVVTLTAEHASGVSGWYTASASDAVRWWQATAPGAPGRQPQQRLMVDMPGTAGRCVGVWAFGTGPAALTEVKVSADAAVLAAVTTADGTSASHEPAPHGWHIGLVAGRSRSSIDLEFLTPGEASYPTPVPRPPRATVPRAQITVPVLTTTDELHERGYGIELGRDAYVQTEEPWGGDNRPTATIRLGCTPTELLVLVEATTGHAPVVPPGGTGAGMPANPLDNERADVNADGVQCYIGVAGQSPGTWRAAVLAVPLADGQARVTTLVPGAPVPLAESRVMERGWHLMMRWPLAQLPREGCTLDVIVNERPTDRERRRGQLRLSGGGGFGYLRGDRNSTATPIGLTLP